MKFRFFAFLSLTTIAFSTNATPSDNTLEASSFSSCSNQTQRIFDGGIIVDKYCNGEKISGIGINGSSAISNANAFENLANSTGISCYISSSSGAVSIFNGGYRAKFFCSSSLTVEGVGTNATDVGSTALQFATLAANTGHECVMPSISNIVEMFSGGYMTPFTCKDSSGGTHGIDGTGTNVTNATLTAIKFAQLSASTQTDCSILGGAATNSIDIFTGGYKVRYYCSNTSGSFPIDGVGSTLTDASVNATGFASIGAVTEHNCYISTNGNITVTPGAFQVRFSCSPGSVTGTGLTATTAANDALSQAEASWL